MGPDAKLHSSLFIKLEIPGLWAVSIKILKQEVRACGWAPAIQFYDDQFDRRIRTIFCSSLTIICIP